MIATSSTSRLSSALLKATSKKWVSFLSFKWCAFLVVNDAVIGTYFFQIYQPPSVRTSSKKISLRPPSSGAGGALGNLNKDWILFDPKSCLIFHQWLQQPVFGPGWHKIIPLCTDNSVLVFVLSHKRVSDWWWWWWWWWWLLGEYPAWIQPTSSCQFTYLFTSFTACTFPASLCHVCSCKMQPMQWEMLPAWPKVCCILKRDWHSLTFLIACHWHCSGPAVVPQILNVTMAASWFWGLNLW